MPNEVLSDSNLLLEIAAFMTALALLIGAVAAAYTSVMQTKKVQQIHIMTTAIDNAVNNRPTHAQTIGQDVDDLHDEMEHVQKRRLTD